MCTRQCSETLLPHSGVTRDAVDAVDTVVNISLTRLQGLHAQHHGSNQEAYAHLEKGVGAGLKALAGANQPGIQWLMSDLVMNLRLAQADIYCCMVRPRSNLSWL